MSERRDLRTTQECARSFMPRFQNLGGLDDPFGIPVPDMSAFRLPVKPKECCDLCLELERLAVRAIGPDLRYESTLPIFFPCREYLVLKLHLPGEDLDIGIYFTARCFNIYSHPGVPCPWHLFKAHPFQNLGWAFDKLHKCETAHDCYAKYPTPLPTRVIRVGRRPHDIRLQNGGFCAPYICLSHCWGSKQPLITNKQNVDDHFGCIVWEDLPPLYQDTIRLAWQLDIDYVWIDSLCIIQNSADDWAREAGRMQYVYGNSWLTIAATSNPDCCSRILDHSCDKDGNARFAFCRDYIKWSGATRQNTAFSWLAVPTDIDTCKNDIHENGNCRWPLLNRGWVLQERLLSRRVLYFTAANLIWSCKMVEQAEGDYSRPTHMGVGSKGTDQCFIDDSWKDIIETYSKLKLTNQHDRLSALSGLAQKFSRGMPHGAKYLAGLWSSSLYKGLSWYNSQEALRDTSTKCLRELCQVHQGTPSWSWAAVNAGVRYPPTFRWTGDIIMGKRYVEIIKAECTPMSPLDPTGRVCDGRIHLRGSTLPITKSGHDLIMNSAHPSAGFYYDCPIHMDLNYLIDNKIKCLLMWAGWAEGLFVPTWGLLLQPVRGKGFEYRRVGLVKVYLHDTQAIWNEISSEVEDLVIV